MIKVNPGKSGDTKPRVYKRYNLLIRFGDISVQDSRAAKAEGEDFGEPGFFNGS